MQDGVVEDDVRRDVVGPGALEPPGTEPLRVARPLALRGRRVSRRAELGEEPRALPGPRQPEDAPRACHADVEEAPLLGDLLVGASLLRRQLLLLEPRQEDCVELEALRAVEREQVHAARAVAAGG